MEVEVEGDLKAHADADLGVGGLDVLGVADGDALVPGLKALAADEDGAVEDLALGSRRLRRLRRP